ncbi:MAG: aminoacyl-tRNA hydrolase [Flavobacteriales bacterium]
MKYLIAGLGNTGVEYVDTRHNIGFAIAEQMAAQCKATFVSGRYADVCEARSKGRAYIIIKPTTYMNLSGNAVRYWMQHENIAIENVMVLTDDLALPFGKIRIRAAGSDGGHNGLKHITEVLQTKNFARLRFGISAEFGKGQQVDYVLSKWNAEELKTLSERVEHAANAVFSFGNIGLERTMNFFNTK